MNGSLSLAARVALLCAAGCAANGTDPGAPGPHPDAPLDGGPAADAPPMLSHSETCELGAVEPCYPGDPADLTTGGECRAGVRRCEPDGEFASWAACEDAVTPGPEVCGDGRDSDCDGLDCGADPGDDAGTVSDAGVGADAGPFDSGPPATIDAGAPTIVDVSISIVGDCQWASCPPETPYPVGCSFTVFGGGSGELIGCVASTPGDSAVYFQAGDSCRHGFILGTLRCSDRRGAALDDTSCPIPKPNPMHVRRPDQCPAITD